MKDKLPLKIGLTGGIACGKTTITKLFSQRGVPIIDADIIARQLVEKGQPTLKMLIKEFGTDIRSSDGSLNRAKLRQRIFTDPEQRKRLEAIIHPRIRQAMCEQMAKLTKGYCILSIPLLLETQQMDIVDRVLVVDCSKEIQKQRLTLRDGLSEEEIQNILMAQAERTKRLAIATEIISNDGELQALAEKVDKLHQIYLKLSETGKQIGSREIESESYKDLKNLFAE